MILKNLLLIASLLNPFNIIQPNLNKNMKFLVSNSRLIAMTPQGAGPSKVNRIINAAKNDGCSSTIAREQKKDGTVVERETLTCTKTIIKKPSGEVKQIPNAESNKLKGPIVQEFFKNHNTKHK